jgi:predicted negative regulator of RcsB-dependent stress response
MSESVYLLSICLVLGTILLVFGMRAFSAVQQAKVRNASEATYRQIAEKAVAAASENTAALSSIQTSLADVRTRLTAIEKVLKEVE